MNAKIKTATLGLMTACAIAGCGSQAATTRTVTVKPSAATTTTPTTTVPTETVAAWKPGSPPPDLTDAQLRQIGVSMNRAWIGDSDTRLGELANMHGDEAQRFGRCIGQQIHIHDVNHEYALLMAWQAKDHAATQAVGSAIGTCSMLESTGAASFSVSLSQNP